MASSSGGRGSDDSGGSGRSTLPVVVVAGTDGPLSKLSRNKDNNCAFFIDEGNFNPRASIFCRRVTADKFPGLSSSQRLSSPVAWEGVAGLNEAQCPSHCQCLLTLGWPFPGGGDRLVGTADWYLSVVVGHEAF